MTARTPLLGAAALTCLLVLTGCGKGGGTGPTGPTGTPGETTRPSATAEPSATRKADEYGIEHRSVTVAPGKEFSLTVPSAATLGEHWYLADPEPDAAVLKYRGDRAAGDGSDADGSTGGTQSFDFTALAKGKATVRLLHCPLHTCTGPGPHDRSTLGPTPDGTASPSPYPTLTADPHSHVGAGFYVFTVTVR
ncbi:protease inhibitor I42 family protein [Streptomyces diastatochromogenes]|uniref:protease inhibitor I42 family protein n=1 Tax=Streptomyces diastatochromogenes TaxID=42236 RepID=UPI00367CDD6F